MNDAPGAASLVHLPDTFAGGAAPGGPPKLFTMKIKILCTLGPASLRGDVIRALEERGVDLFRINLSHTPPEAVEPTITLIRRYSNAPICLDTQGAQVRCGKMAEGTALDGRHHRHPLRRRRHGLGRADDAVAGVGVPVDAARRPDPRRLRRGAAPGDGRRRRPRFGLGRRARRWPGEVEPGRGHGPAALARPDHRQGRDGHRDRRAARDPPLRPLVRLAVPATSSSCGPSSPRGRR